MKTIQNSPSFKSTMYSNYVFFLIHIWNRLYIHCVQTIQILCFLQQNPSQANSMTKHKQTSSDWCFLWRTMQIPLFFHRQQFMTTDNDRHNRTQPNTTEPSHNRTVSQPNRLTTEPFPTECGTIEPNHSWFLCFSPQAPSMMLLLSLWFVGASLL